MNEIDETKILEDAKKDSRNIALSYHLDMIRLNTILEHCKSLSVDITNNKIFGIVEASQDGSLELVVENMPLFEKQTFNELFIVTGISYFEKYCKDWFIWGLKYSPKRLNIFGNKQITFLEVTKSKDIKQTLINKIVDDINFQEALTCDNIFRKVFGFKIFDNREERYKFEKYLNHRHVISHNLGYIDDNFIERAGLDGKYAGGLLFIDDDELEDLKNLLFDVIAKIGRNIHSIICEELENDTKKE